MTLIAFDEKKDPADNQTPQRNNVKRILKISPVYIVVLLALLPGSTFAAKLGGLTVLSNTGEPFNAEISYRASETEQDGLIARIAPADVYKEQGIEFSPVLSEVKVELSKRPDGTTIIRLSSAQPHGAPFLDLLIQLEWATGRSMREYSTVPNIPVPNDQPQVVTNSPTPENIVKNPIPEPLPAIPEPLQANAELTNEKTSEDTGKPSATATTESIKLPKKSQPKLSTSKKPAASPNTAEKLDHYTTKKGDSLNAIAVRYRAESVSLEQMLVGLFNANKAAFAGSNMNRLKAGEEIKIPGLDTLQTISQAEAVEEIRVQAEDWETYRMNLAGLAKGEKSSSEQNPAQISTGKVIALSGQDSAQTATEPRDVVKLSTGGAHDGKSNIQKPSEQIAALQDEAVARARELKEAGENTKQLEKQVRDMSKLITIKNQMLAQKSNIHNDSRTSLLGFVTKHIWIALGGVSLLLGLLIAIRLTLRSKKKNLSD